METNHIPRNDHLTNFLLTFLKLNNTKENSVYSPLSILCGLNMLKDGSNGNTKMQLESQIGIQPFCNTYSNIYPILSFANGLFIKDSYAQHIKEDYKNWLTSNYHAEIKLDSFKNLTTINDWIKNKTLGIIQNILDTTLLESTDTLLINALAIDMEWEDDFDASSISIKNFHLENGSIIPTVMMQKETSNNHFSYYQDETITSVTMDLKKYENIQLEFIAIMPNDNLSTYIENFHSDILNDITNHSTLASETKYGIAISIPRFSFNNTLLLKENLMHLGITDMFDNSLADFSNISNNTLFINDILHKATIDFTEKGIKASAVTLTFSEGMFYNPTPPKVININRPFLFFIRDKVSKDLWFTGTVYEPILPDKSEIHTFF